MIFPSYFKVTALLLIVLVSSVQTQTTEQSPLAVTTTSCRTFITNGIPTPAQTTSKTSSAPPSMTTLCATNTRPARISLLAEPGVFANVYDSWGGCSQYIQFGFDQNWREYRFGAAHYDNPQEGCTGKPTATMTCGIGVSGRLEADETFKLAPTAPYGGRVHGSRGSAGWIQCDNV